jgi:hypothetical protein
VEPPTPDGGVLAWSRPVAPRVESPLSSELRWATAAMRVGIEIGERCDARVSLLYMLDLI